jgi:hypothetical protein
MMSETWALVSNLYRRYLQWRAAAPRSMDYTPWLEMMLTEKEAEAKNAQVERLEVLEVLKKVEWDEMNTCPICQGNNNEPECSDQIYEGHKPDCRLAALIKKLQSDSLREAK